MEKRTSVTGTRKMSNGTSSKQAITLLKIISVLCIKCWRFRDINNFLTQPNKAIIMIEDAFWFSYTYTYGNLNCTCSDYGDSVVDFDELIEIVLSKTVKRIERKYYSSPDEKVEWNGAHTPVRNNSKFQNIILIYFTYMLDVLFTWNDPTSIWFFYENRIT